MEASPAMWTRCWTPWLPKNTYSGSWPLNLQGRGNAVITADCTNALVCFSQITLIVFVFCSNKRQGDQWESPQRPTKAILRRKPLCFACCNVHFFLLHFECIAKIQRNAILPQIEGAQGKKMKFRAWNFLQMKLIFYISKLQTGTPGVLSQVVVWKTRDCHIKRIFYSAK